MLGNVSYVTDLLFHSRLARKVFLFPDSAEGFRQANTSTRLVEDMAASWTQGMEDSAYTMVGRLVKCIGRIKEFGGVFSYLTSRWALVTFAVAILLNRTQFYASSREHLRLRWIARLVIYALPISLFLSQMLSLLQAMRCQTSPDFAQLRYGDVTREVPMDFGGEGGFLYKLSSTLLWWQDDGSCCAARRMLGEPPVQGSMSLLFPFFITLCTSQLFETLACALQGRQPVPETGMTLFEHSLAFAECEAMVSAALGIGFTAMPNLGTLNAADQSEVLLTRNDILQHLNVPPEVLLVCLISCFSHLSSATLAITGLRDRVRLVNTGIWACSYMAAFLWSFTKIVMSPSAMANAGLGILRFPTVCIVGFIPHVLILAGIVLCSIIYSTALLLTAISVPSSIASNMTLARRLGWAYNNLQANVQFQGSIRLKMSDDFYTTILKVGFQVLTAASEAVYLNEGIRVQIAKSTWIERKRMAELQAEAQHKMPHIPSELLGEEIARGVGFVEQLRSSSPRSPYARERRSKTKSGEERLQIETDSGLGVSQRRSRMQLTFDYIANLFWLVLGLYAQVASDMVRRIGFTPPSWLSRAAWKLDKSVKHRNGSRLDDVVMTGDAAWIALASDNDDDTEYEPSLLDEDVTSVVSIESEGYEWSDRGDRTPTQASFNEVYDHSSRESTPVSDLEFNLNDLSEMLNPTTVEMREQARLLSYSLKSRQPLTRQSLRRAMNHDRSRLLFGDRQQDLSKNDEQELENFLIQQRCMAKEKTGASWATGAEGMGEGGPQCVVCQSTPRTILVWPCGCLSMCDDCRIGLAARNFTQCVCCRTDIAAYSRLYVP